jgi:thioredoxin-related protein
LTQRHLLLITVSVVILVGEMFICEQTRFFIKEADLNAGDKFPLLRVRTIDTDSTQPLTIDTACVIVFIRNGCAHCKSLKDTFNIINTEGIKKPKIFLISIDKTPDEIVGWAHQFIYNSENNDIYFSSTPQTYFVDKTGVILKKRFGTINKSTLKKGFSSLFDESK